jgi:hypothetical protein
MKLPAISRLFSSTPSESTSQKKISAIGAYAGTDPYNTYATTLKWIKETKAKLPDGSTFEINSSMREDAFNVDPLLSGIITPFLKNTLLGSYSIETLDNKKFEPAIKEIRKWISEIGLMEAFREDFKDYAIVHGHSYRRLDPTVDKLESLAPLDNATFTTYTDPWDASVVAYHQKIFVENSWSDSSTADECNSWFIPNGKLYIENGNSEEGAKAIFDELKAKYNITDVAGLRVDSNERIIAMHRVKPGEPAPIDSAILAIWLKRLLLTNSPNIIFRVLSPFVQVKNGLVLEVTGADGGKELITTVPQQPPADMATTDPERYEAENAIYNSYIAACKTSASNVLACLKDGGIFSSGPDTELQVVESGRSVPSAFIKTMLDLLDQEIGQAFGFPVALVKANGSELATSRSIMEMLNTTFAGARRDYETVANRLVRKKFGGMTWSYKITGKDGAEETGTFTFDDMEASFKIDPVNVKDLYTEAQTARERANTIQVLKAVGAGKTDVQALGEEYGFGMLDLDNFDTAQDNTFQPFTNNDPHASVKSTINDDLQPSEVAEEDDLSKLLLKAYEKGAAKIKEL